MVQFSNQTLVTTTRYVLRIGAFFVLLAPLAVAPFILFPFVVGKTLFITLIVVAMLPFLVVRIFLSKASPLHGSFIPHFVGLFLVINIIAALMGIDVRQSFFGTDERGSGVIVSVVMGLWWLACTYIPLGRVGWRIFVGEAVVVGALVTLFGIRENMLVGGTRVGALFGNPILFGNYLLFPCFLAFYLAAEAKKIAPRTFAFILAITNAYGVWIAQTRGVLFGLGAGLFVAIGAVLFGTRGKIRTLAAGVATLGMLSVVLVFALRDYPIIRKNPSLSRITHISLREESANERVLLWGGALHAFKERPLFGWGPENFDYAFDRFYNPRFLYFSIAETWSDRAHNMFLDALVMTGIAGLIVFTGLFIVCAHAIFRARRRGAISTMGAAALYGLVAAYAAQGFFAFDGPATTLMFFFLLAYVHSLTRVSGAPEGTAPRLKRYTSALAVAGASAAVAIVVLRGAIRLSTASNAMLNAVTRHHAEGATVAREATFALAPSTVYRDSMRLRFANRVFEDALNYSREDAHTLLPLAIAETKKLRTAHPRDFASAFLLGNLFTQAGRVLDASFLSQAKEAYGEAVLLSPTRQAVYFQLASVAVLEGDLSRAEELFRRARDLDHAVGEGWWRWALVAAKQGDAIAAIQGFERALHERYAPKSVREVTFAAQFAIDRGADKLGEALFARAIIIAPERVSEWGDPGEATKLFVQAIGREPTRDDLWQALDELYRVFQRETALVEELVRTYSKLDDPIVQAHVNTLTQLLGRT